MSSKVQIPVDEMIELHCALYSDSVDVSSFVIVDYEEVESCSSCLAAKVASMERAASTFKTDEPLGVVHIISACREDSVRICKDFCRERIHGVVLLDTCNAFLAANPQFPALSLLHTFVMDRHGKVLLVGNPFKSEKMESMFYKIVKEHRTSSVGV